MRLLVCGSRLWTCGDTIETWLLAMNRAARRRNETITLIHGGCGKRNAQGVAYEGADEIAHDIASILGWTIERYEADWSLGDSAGPIRNQYMFDHSCPDRGLAFGPLWKPGTRDRKRTGTGGMVDIMNAGGILVTVVPKPGVMP